MEDTKIFAKNLKRLMLENNLNQTELAKKIGLSEAAISRYLNGTRFPSTKVVAKLMEAFNCKTSDLFESKDEQLAAKIVKKIEANPASKILALLTESEKRYLISVLKN